MNTFIQQRLHFSHGAWIYRVFLSMLSLTNISTGKCDYTCITHTLMWVFICVFWVPEFGHRAVEYSVTRNTRYRGLYSRGLWQVARDTLNHREEEAKKQRQEKNWRKLKETDQKYIHTTWSKRKGWTYEGKNSIEKNVHLTNCPEAILICL